MICKKCGKAIPASSGKCPYCGADINGFSNIHHKNINNVDLISDRYGIDKEKDYQEREQKVEKLNFSKSNIGALIIIGILIFLIFLVILIGMGR